mmetsp:Transcript_10825/g.15312  ORF Transcript_10825/g.15312 Transcript_10825/m.15312 type:complete len:1257 (+) Transcript_10825:147-3917(+)|eukprot:CAMPEP_0171456952 /NCGR_PEP_ID=MMETSP0945-20130129/3231_1 /TAXON_ID=109269 /ORGANISM="Vaucheria litorea, Strain CCMP2940" /LENGTH=1256 /DNA_ID=CAMNT_0011982475 /DNA_START=132 /DNA_END=3902 /DNA_ORIENTATION=+
MRYSVLRSSGATLLLLHSALSASIRGFDSNSPVVPGENDLVVELIWQFDPANLADGITKLQWVPGSERVISSHKSGLIRMHESILSEAEDYVTLINMMPDVNSDGDHGLLSFQFHPDFENGQNFAYAMYTGNPKDVSLLPNNDVVAPIREWGEDFAGLYEWPQDKCPDLGDDNLNGSVCEKVYYIDRLIVDLDGEVPAMTKDITLFSGVCGSSSTHGPGTILQIGEDIVFSMGDGSQYDAFDPGFADKDGCFVPDGGADQGIFRSQREDFPNGKVFKIPKEFLDSEEPITMDDLIMISRGNRQPYNMFYHEENDVLYIADVGFGDWGTTERLFLAPNVSTIVESDPFNWGWPCLEGMYSTAEDHFLGNYNPFDGPSEKLRAAYLEDQGLNTCDGVYEAVAAIVGGETPSAVADPKFREPIFEYRNDVLDPDYPTMCVMSNAAVTSVFVYEGEAMPEEFRGKLMFADHVKKCVWYFDNDENGNPDTLSRPHILIANVDVIDMQIAPDGTIYFVDYMAARVFRMFEYGKGVAEGVETPPPTTAPTAAPFALPEIIDEANMCFDGRNMPELKWERNDDGSYTTELTIGAVTYETSQGITRTRGFNGMIPAPIMRLKACNTYHVKFYNEMEEWPEGFDGNGAVNAMKDPNLSSLHLHGMHISGMPPGDDVLQIVEPGEMHEYVYTIPCDHISGTHLYHTHHHGSTALQTDAGAAGIIIIESNAREASDMPLDIQSMPEQYLTIQEFDPIKTSLYALEARDRLYITEATTPYTMINGCEEPVLTLEQGQWTRLRMMNIGHEYNSLLTILPMEEDEEPCQMGLLAKDGVWVAEVPRELPGNAIFLSVSSRVDVAIKCPIEGLKHSILMKQIARVGVETGTPVATIEIVESARPADPDLTPWAPCRPYYLMDRQPESNVGESFTLEVRDGLNTEYFTSADNYIREMDLDVWEAWRVSATDLHPFHIHINHMQFGEVTEENQWNDIPDWNQPGDWIDTLSAPGAVPINLHPEKYTGAMVMHCHIAQHADMGILGIVLINGEGDDGTGDGAITDYGTCEEMIPDSTPYNTAAVKVPGVVQAEEFDIGGEGIGYHNINIDRNTGNAMRATEAVEVDTDGTTTWVSYIREGEWLQYSIDIEEKGFYDVVLNIASDGVPEGINISLWLDAKNECPAPGSMEGNLQKVFDPDYEGTGSPNIFESYNVEGYIELPAGEHTLMLCFEGSDGGFNFDSLAIEFCGITENACLERKLIEKNQITISYEGEILK